MPNVTSRVRLNMPRIRQLSRGAVRALEMTAEALHTEVVQAEVLPRGTGALTLNTFCDYKDSTKGKVSIVCQTPYARRLYFHPEYHFRQTEHRNAKGKWFDDWISGDKKNFAQNAFIRFYRREAGL